MKKGEVTLGLIFTVFIVVIVGIALLSFIGDAIWESTNTFSVDNEAVDVSAARLGDGTFDETVEVSIANDNIISVTTATHNNGTVIS